MNFFENSVFFSSVGDGDGVNPFSDKRNRNPNWTDQEIIRFLEILQEEDTMKDLMAQRNKQVFCYVAQRMCAEGADKTWDQCRIKLKNLKSQYRFVKDRIPNIDDLDLEDDEVVKELIAKCQGRGISPSSIKHLRFLKRFLNRQSSASFENSGSQSMTRPSSSSSPAVAASTTLASLSANPASPLKKILLGPKNSSHHIILPQKSMLSSNSRPIHADTNSHDEESVSPPSTPLPSQTVRIISSADDEPDMKRGRFDEGSINDGGADSSMDDVIASEGYKYIEKFNRDMMDQFLDFQRRSQASFIRWEQERVRQEHLALERWRQEARDHEKQLFGMFCHAMAQCNAALTTMLKSSARRNSEESVPGSTSAEKRGKASSDVETQNGENHVVDDDDDDVDEEEEDDS